MASTLDTPIVGDGGHPLPLEIRAVLGELAGLPEGEQAAAGEILRAALIVLLTTIGETWDVSAKEARKAAPGIVAMAAALGLLMTEREIVDALVNAAEPVPGGRAGRAGMP